MASLSRRTWVWVSPGSWLLTGRPGVLSLWGHKDWTQLSDWNELIGKKKKKVAVHIGEILSSRIYGIIIKYPLHFYRCVLYNALWKDGTVLHLHSSTWKYVFIHGLTKHCVLIFAFFKLWVWANVFVFKSHIVPL